MCIVYTATSIPLSSLWVLPSFYYLVIHLFSLCPAYALSHGNGTLNGRSDRAFQNNKCKCQRQNIFITRGQCLHPLGFYRKSQLNFYAVCTLKSTLSQTCSTVVREVSPSNWQCFQQLLMFLICELYPHISQYFLCHFGTSFSSFKKIWEW
jgi:hypothetical protein